MARKDFDLMFYHVGNGIIVADRNREQYGDYKQIAQIMPDRKIRWDILNLPTKVKNKIIRYSKTANPQISQSQTQKVFEKMAK